MRTTVLLCFLVGTAASAQTPPSVPTFLNHAEIRRAIQTAPEGGDVADQAGLYSLRLSPPAESPVLGLRRTAPGKSELHANFTDVWYIIDGAATLVTGGTVEDGTEATPGEVRGRGIKNGSSRHVQTGDFAVIPAGTPHWISKVEGEEILYIVAKMPKP
ncbi:MAG TPA: hypothetical protein VLB12_17020 [Gemmatimonadales bacterium]|nr:hypothetical protein [Gemmatimonadales bacterium]